MHYRRHYTMHYYSFNIGDYSSHTSRLPPIQDLAYRRILDLYYLTERPLSGCSTDVAQEIGLFDFESDVAFVLGKYFYEDDGNWVNDRCESEILVYKNKQKMASKAGKASGKARKLKACEHTFNERSTDVQPTIKQEPITSNHKPITSKQETSPKDISDAGASSSISNEINQRMEDVFKYWQERFNKQKTKLTADRKGKIRSRLSTHSVEDLKSAIDGCAGSGYHMGQNHDRKIYNSIDLIFRNAGKVDEFIDIHQNNANQQDQYEGWINAE